MPKKQKTRATQEDQAARFRAEVERLIEAGELNLTEADERFEALMGRLAKPEKSPPPN